MIDEDSVTHLAFPFRFGGDGTAAVVEQGTYEEVEQNVKVLILTDVGERIEVPDFGVPDPVFQSEIDTSAIAEAATTWDERASAIVDEGPDAIQRLARRVTVQIEEK